jgi:glutathione synthase/RimK-type ligase-like ATP-grasp enzyme
MPVTALAKNKYVTRRILERHNMQNIPFALPRTQVEATTFLDQYGTIVAKPVAGAGARNIHIITNQAGLRALKIDQYILEKYIAGKELRYLLLDGKIIGVHRSEYGTSVAEDRPLQRISYPSHLWDPVLLNVSLRIADIFNLKFAAVDYLVDAFGQSYILEVNTTPGLKWFHAPSSGPVVDVARLFLESVVSNARLERPFAPDSAISGSQGRIVRV